MIVANKTKKNIFRWIIFYDRLNISQMTIVTLVISFILSSFSLNKPGEVIELTNHEFPLIYTTGLFFVSLFPYIFYSRRKYAKKLEKKPLILLILAIYLSLMIPVVGVMGTSVISNRVEIGILRISQAVVVLELFSFLAYLFYQNFKMVILRKKRIGEKDIIIMFVTYIVTGIVFGALYFFIDIKTPRDAFYGVTVGKSITFVDYVKYMYFSFITLTSTGYGDIYPIMTITRVIAVIEAVSGVFLISFSLGIVFSANGANKKN